MYGNIVQPDLIPKETMVIALIYAHSRSRISDDQIRFMNPIGLSSKNPQKPIFKKEYIEAIKYFFEKNQNTDGFKLVCLLIRYPAFYCYKSEDSLIKGLLNDFIKFDSYLKTDTSLFQNIGTAVSMHALIPLWAVSITKYLTKRSLKSLRKSFTYIADIKFIRSFTVYLYKMEIDGKDDKNTEISLLKKAFEIVFDSTNQSSSFNSSKLEERSYNSLFPVFDDFQKKRESIIYDFNQAVKKFFEIDNSEKLDMLVNEISLEKYNIKISDDFKNRQKEKAIVHPYLNI